MFQCPVAFSDHTPGWDMDIAAVALGANLIEKTITEDRTQRSPEHVMSLEPSDAGGFVKAIRELEIAMGSNRRTMTKEEKSARALRRRSAIAMNNYPAGTPLDQMALDYARPGNGLAPDEVEKMNGAYLSEGIAAGALLTLQHLRFRNS
jgi:sialic acid synthase SpsE